MKKRYIVESIVCDYEVVDTTTNKSIEICNSYAGAVATADILNFQNETPDEVEIWLAEHDKKVRKTVCDEIRCKLMENEYSELKDNQGIKYAWFNLPAFSEILDRIAKGE